MRVNRRRRRTFLCARRNWFRVWMSAAILGASGLAISCRSPGSGGTRTIGSPPISRLDRLTATYPELRAGRYAVIADFEDPNHTELFRAEGREGARSRVRLETESRGGRSETGPGCLSANFVTSDDAILIDNEHATQWSLKRDWHEYDLLLLAVHSPSAAVDVLLTVRSGATTGDANAPGMGTATTRQRLTRGWNLLRFDLADLGEQVALDDVREIRIAADTAKWPIEVRFDDIILTSSLTKLFGDPDARDGAMFTYQKGRRYHIGAGGKFELVFGNGQIVGWYDLAADPRRVRNLWQGVTLGFARDGGANRDSAAPGSGIAVASQLREASAVRSVVVVEVFAGSQAPTAPAALVYRWTHNIYPTGKAYTSVEFGPKFSSVLTNPPSLLFTEAHSGGEFGSIHFSGWPREGEDRQYGFFSPHGAAAGMAAIATIPIDDTKSTDRRTPRSSEGLSFGPAHPEQFDRTRPWLFSLAHSDHSLGRLHPALVDENPATFLGWFDGPERIAIVARAGKTVAETVAFDGGSGTYRVNANGGSVRLDLGTESGGFYSPVFVIAETPSTDAWVYANSKLVTPTARDADGNLIFQLPGVIREETIVEVLFDQQSATAPK